MGDISVNESFLTNRAGDYAVLSDLSYAQWSNGSDGWKTNEKYQELWDEMVVKGYRVLAHMPNTQTGYSGTLFEYKDKNTNAVTRILVNRLTSIFGWTIACLSNLIVWCNLLNSSNPILP